MLSMIKIDYTLILLNLYSFSIATIIVKYLFQIHTMFFQEYQMQHRKGDSL